MFSSALDTVRLADEKQLTLVEAFLMRSALSGNPAVLSPNQAIDSAAIQAIVAGNDLNGTNHFIRAVEKGIVRVSLPGGTRSLLEHCLNTLNRSKDNPDNEFLFSSLKFLYAKENGISVYDYEFRRKILDYISDELSQARYRNHKTRPLPVTLSPEEQELVHRYIQVLIELDQAIRYYDQYSYKKELYPQMVMNALTDRLQTLPRQCALAELIVQILPACQIPHNSMYRSFYYRLCDRYVYDYGIEAVQEVREILDICYNKLIAISMDEQAELNIAPSFAETAVLQASASDVSQTLLATSNRVDNVTQKLDWEVLVEIYEGITALCNEKHLYWQEALELYHARQSALPFVLSGKYALITSLTMAISSIPVVGTLINNVVAEILLDAAFGEMENVMGKPSVKDIVRESKKADQKKHLIDLIICTAPQTNLKKGTLS